MELRVLLERLADPRKQQPLTSSLPTLSALAPEEVALFKNYWAKTEAPRRRNLASRLVVLAEDHPEYDFTAIFRTFLDDPEEFVKLEGIEGLWEDESIETAAMLLRLLKEDPSKEVRAAAASALGRYTYLTAVGQLVPSMSREVKKALLAVIDNSSEALDVRRRAVEAIAFLSEEPRVAQIIQEAYGSDNPEMKASSLFAMGRHCDVRWLDILLRELTNTDPEIRYEAARACGELEDRRAVQPLIEMLEDQDIEVKLAAIESLGQIGGAEARQALQRLLNSDDEAIRSAAEEAVEEAWFQEDALKFPF